MGKATASKSAPWFADALAKGIGSIESITIGDDHCVAVRFRSEDAPIKDVLDVIGRMGELHYAEDHICRNTGKGPELVLIRL
jgi:hypothetical protein